MAKFYQLVAWTEIGQVKMIPSLLAELAEPYVERIQGDEDESEVWGENAFLRYADAAITVTNCSDCCWKDAEVGYLLHTPLGHRFLAMYNYCSQIAEEHPALKGSVPRRRNTKPPRAWGCLRRGRWCGRNRPARYRRHGYGRWYGNFSPGWYRRCGCARSSNSSHSAPFRHHADVPLSGTSRPAPSRRT